MPLIEVVIMTLEELYNKCSTLDYSLYETMTTNLIDTIMYPLKLEHGQWDYEQLQARFNHKVIYSETTNDEKNGNRLSMLYLDEVPMLLFNQFGKWIDCYSVYRFSDEKLEQVQAVLRSLYISVLADEDLMSTLITEKHLTDPNDWLYRALHAGDFPHINDI